MGYPKAEAKDDYLKETSNEDENMARKDIISGPKKMESSV